MPSRKPQSDACFDSQFCRCHHGNHNPMLVLTYNFATALTETTTLNLCTLATILLLVSSFQNCELKQEVSTLTTELQQTNEFHGHGKIYLQPLQKCGVRIVRICGFGGYFCFNSKPSFSFESRGQRITFPVASKYSCNHSKGRFRVKTSPPQNIVANTKGSV